MKEYAVKQEKNEKIEYKSNHELTKEILEIRMKKVLITGGTSGIGFELAKLYAQDGYGLLISSSNKVKLEKVKTRLKKTYSCQVWTYQEDLSRVGGAEKLVKKIKKDGHQVDILVNNAGIGTIGEAIHINDHEDENMMILNMISLSLLCKIYLREMYQKGKGKILNISSVAAFQPGPYSASYYATKSYVDSYSRALHYESKKWGISVCTAYPGTTCTEFFHRAGVETPRCAMSSKRVAKLIYIGFQKNRSVIIPGFANGCIRWIPGWIKTKIIAIDRKSVV